MTLTWTAAGTGDRHQAPPPAPTSERRKTSNLYFIAWYAYGLRGIEISDPYNPVEAGHFFYRNFGGQNTSVTYDINFGPKGLLYVTDNVDGIRLLKYTGQGRAEK